MKAIFAGAFDPFTLGHLDVAARAAKAFDEVVIAVANVTDKVTADIDKRVAIAKLSVSALDNVIVMPFDGLLTDFAKTQGKSVIVRGIRNSVDFEYESDHSRVYDLLGGVDTVCFITKPEYKHISSSVVREMVGLDCDINGYVSTKAVKLIKSTYSIKETL
ncbi:MAG: pantetheine-phosphate adenylyltransferase [Clostridiales bacterium]|nr:pantetheine-phosphate adenylyltransferase [Clostridiales bacterium]